MSLLHQNNVSEQHGSAACINGFVQLLLHDINGVFIRFQWPESAIPGTGLASKLKSNIHADVAEYQEYFIKQDRAR